MSKLHKPLKLLVIIAVLVILYGLWRVISDVKLPTFPSNGNGVNRVEKI
jgi:hypothetical protein